MEDDQRLYTLVYEGDALHFSLQHCKTEIPVQADHTTADGET